MKTKLMLNLKIDEEASLCIKSIGGSGNCYVDSCLYFINGARRYCLTRDSFVYSTGGAIYSRLFQKGIKPFTGNDIVSEDEKFDDYVNSENFTFNLSDEVSSFPQEYEFMPYDKGAVYLYRVKDCCYLTILNKKINGKGGIERKVLFHAAISSGKITEWKNMLKKDYVPYLLAETYRINRVLMSEGFNEAFSQLSSDFKMAR